MTIFIHIGGSISLETNNQLTLELEFNPHHALIDVVAYGIYKENLPHLKLLKRRQLQDIHKMKYLLEGKKRGIGVELVGEGMDNLVKGELLFKLKTVIKIVCMKIDLNGEVCIIEIKLRMISLIMNFG